MNMQEVNISDNNFEQCIKCTVCTVYCPVVPVNPQYPGPKQAGPDGERLRLKRGEFFDEALKYCLNCKRCEVACPSNVKIGDIIQLARIKYSKKKPSLRDMMLANTDFVGSMATKFAPIVNTTLSLAPVKTVMDGVLKIDKHRTFQNTLRRHLKVGLRKRKWISKTALKTILVFFMDAILITISRSWVKIWCIF